MTLHRDIYWVGKQWAVTGHGIQACNQKQRSRFDIEGARLWDDGVQDAVRAEAWVNIEDFEKAVAAARAHYPEPPRKPKAQTTAAPPAEIKPPEPVQLPRPEPPPMSPAVKFDLRVEGCGKLTPVWRIRTHIAVSPDNRPAE
jgi:hypothetical protein